MNEQNDTRDEIKTCCDCGSDFTWTAGEALFYESRNLKPTRRCRPCRTKRRIERDPLLAAARAWRVAATR